MSRNHFLRASLAFACAAFTPAGAGGATGAGGASEQAATGAVLETDLGDIEIRFFADRAPETVANFVQYARDGHYDGLIFHRVIPGFVIQGGGLDVDMDERDTRDPVKNEADNGIKNKKGTLSMARTPAPHSATSQFFINLADNANLDFRSQTPAGWGYAVFAEVVSGADVVRQIAQAPTTTVVPHRDVPQKPVAIRAARILP